ncbi:hypothetical protein LY76DRAFT_591598 [Colletotrichum caudatum]|nr:hypothetical protein LY76DRAFT_591598 [Colletotrichum caudatum]
MPSPSANPSLTNSSVDISPDYPPSASLPDSLPGSWPISLPQDIEPVCFPAKSGPRQQLADASPIARLAVPLAAQQPQTVSWLWGRLIQPRTAPSLFCPTQAIRIVVVSRESLTPKGLLIGDEHSGGRPI